MIWALAVLALAAVAASGTAVVLALRSGNDREVAAKLMAQLQRRTEQHGDAVRQLGAEVAGRVDDQQRYEAVIAAQKAEIARLEGELDADLDPTAVRERLAGSGLLGGPAEGTVAADRSAATGGLPARPASILGTAHGGPRGPG